MNGFVDSLFSFILRGEPLKRMWIVAISEYKRRFLLRDYVKNLCNFLLGVMIEQWHSGQSEQRPGTDNLFFRFLWWDIIARWMIIHFQAKSHPIWLSLNVKTFVLHLTLHGRQTDKTATPWNKVANLITFSWLFWH